MLKTQNISTFNENMTTSVFFLYIKSHFQKKILVVKEINYSKNIINRNEEIRKLEHFR